MANNNSQGEREKLLLEGLTRLHKLSNERFLDAQKPLKREAVFWRRRYAQEVSALDQEVSALKEWNGKLQDYVRTLEQECNRLQKESLGLRLYNDKLNKDLLQLNSIRTSFRHLLSLFVDKIRRVNEAEKANNVVYSPAEPELVRAEQDIQTEIDQNEASLPARREPRADRASTESLAVEAFIVSRDTVVSAQACELFYAWAGGLEQILCLEVSPESLPLVQMLKTTGTSVTYMSETGGVHKLESWAYRLSGAELDTLLSKELANSVDSGTQPLAFNGLMFSASRAQEILERLQGRLQAQTRLFIYGQFRDELKISNLLMLAKTEDLHIYLYH